MLDGGIKDYDEIEDGDEEEVVFFFFVIVLRL